MPPESSFSRPINSPTCGSAMTINGGESKTVRSDGYPSHRRNQQCVWSFKCASGFLPQIEFPSLNIESRYAVKLNVL